VEPLRRMVMDPKVGWPELTKVTMGKVRQR
jgi:hypothetical protein